MTEMATDALPSGEYVGDDRVYEGDEIQPYRALSRAAIASMALAVASLIAVVFPLLLIVPAAGAVLGWVARRNIRRYPDELTGRTLAGLAIAACLLLLFGGAGWHIYEYTTEVPDGYRRISFADLQLKPERKNDGEGLPMELDGQRVFVKGYVHPGVSSMGKIRKFVLVPDMGTCCFGGQPKMTDMIEVTLEGSQAVAYSRTKRKLAGTLHVRNRIKKVAGGLDGGYYELRADSVK